MTNVGVFHPGTQHSWQTALALQQLGRLEFYATSIFYRPDRWPYRLERWVPRLAHEFRRFAHPDLDPALVRTHGFWEWAERFATRARAPRLAHRLNAKGNKAFAGALARSIAGPRPFALWGYDTSSLESFQLAKRHGRACILDRTIGDYRYYAATLEREAIRHPRWFAGDPMAPDRSRFARDDAEYALADRIVVGSAFARQTLINHSPVPGLAERISVLPYCFDAAAFPPPAPRSAAGGPVRFLFVGLVGVRKGIHRLLEAFSAIPPGDATLTVVGQPLVAPERLAPYTSHVTFTGNVPRAEVPALMARHDVLVLPSLFEGSAITLIEALASGMGVIQSAAAGSGATPDTGLVLEDADGEALTEALLTPIRDRARLAHWQAHARAEAENYSFAHYRERIAALLDAMEL